jgi:hypothetical protein
MSVGFATRGRVSLGAHQQPGGCGTYAYQQRAASITSATTGIITTRTHHFTSFILGEGPSRH